MSRRICLALDLVDDADLIAGYDHWHRAGNTDPAVTRSIRDAGITDMQIYRAHDRLFMIIEAGDAYCDDAKEAADAANPAVVAWVEKMARFQRPIPAAGPDGTWYPMDRIFRLTDHAEP